VMSKELDEARLKHELARIEYCNYQNLLSEALDYMTKCEMELNDIECREEVGCEKDS